MKKLIAVFVAVLMVVSVLSVSASALAADDAPEALLLTDENKGSLKTVPGMVLLEQEEEKKGGFIAQSNDIRRGKIVQIVYPEDMKPEEVPPFKVGDTVMLTSKCEVYDGFADKRLVAMRFEEIVARFD